MVAVGRRNAPTLPAYKAATVTRSGSLARAPPQRSSYWMSASTQSSVFANCANSTGAAMASKRKFLRV